MNNEKVYLKGYVVGHTADTLGYKGLQIQLENMDIVEVDKNLVYKNVDEPQKPAVPQFVADWIEEGKKHCKDVSDLFDFDFTNKEVGKWFLQEKPFDLVARAWLDGYEVEKEKRYSVKIKGKIEENLLVYGLGINRYFFARTYDSSKRNEHTRKELEEAGFGWVFDCPGIEIEEVEE
jgi:hypothetical protein